MNIYQVENVFIYVYLFSLFYKKITEEALPRLGLRGVLRRKFNLFELCIIKKTGGC